MKKFLSEAFDAYRKYRNFKKQNRAYKIFRYTLTGIFAAYFLTLVFPQYLFAHEVSHKNFKVYARKPIDENINRVLDLAEERLMKSPIYNKETTERILSATVSRFILSNIRLAGNLLPARFPASVISESIKWI